MEPGHEDREYGVVDAMRRWRGYEPQWSPVMKTGNTSKKVTHSYSSDQPQWSPVMKTGNTCPGCLITCYN